MPLLDVSAVISSPFFADQITIERSRQVVDSQGLVTTIKTLIPATAVVTEGDIEEMERYPWFALNKDTIYVVTTKALYTNVELPDGSQYQADVIIWYSERYVVKKIYDYGKFGVGHFQAICVIEDTTGSPSRDQ